MGRIRSYDGTKAFRVVFQASSGGRADLSRDNSQLEKIAASLGITIPNHVLRSKDPRAVMMTLFGAWLPLSTAVLVSVVEQLPSPIFAQAQRFPDIIAQAPGTASIDQKVRDAVTQFKTSLDDPVVAYVSKMVSVPIKEFPRNKRKKGNIMTAEEARELARRKRAEIAKAQADAAAGHAMNGMTDVFANASLDGPEPELEFEEQAEEPEELIGFARLYSGSLSVGDSVYVIPPKYSPTNPLATAEARKATITALYMLMGRSLEALATVPAGVVFGIGGLEGFVLKSGTLCSQSDGALNLAGMTMGGEPIVRVAVEPTNPLDLDKMVAGLKLLEQSDASARYEVLESGEHVILVAGELHLERCLKDLRERFARCEVQVSEPLVPYRETIINAQEMAAPKQKDLARGTVIAITNSKIVTVRLRVRPLPETLTEFLQKEMPSIRRLYAKKKAKEDLIKGRPQTDEETEEPEHLPEEPIRSEEGLTLTDFTRKLKEVLREVKDRDYWTNAIDKIVAFGPRRIGPNLLIDATRHDICGKL